MPISKCRYSSTVTAVKESIRKNFGGKAKLPTVIAIGVLLVAGIVLGLYLGKVGPIYTFIHHHATVVAVGAGAALVLVVGLPTWLAVSIHQQRKHPKPFVLIQ